MTLLFSMMCSLFAIGVPVAWAMGISSALYMHFVIGVPLQSMPQRMWGGLDSFPLLAIPFFIFAGSLMNTGGITNRLVDFAKALVGHITGGLGHVAIVANMIMAGMSGSAVADASGTSAVLIPAMERAGFPKRFSVALIASAAVIGPIIPPSIPMVIYGSMASVSIGRMLIAGALPGILLGIVLMIFTYFIAKKRGYQKEARTPVAEVFKRFKAAIPPLGLVVIVLGGILAGIMTPTEAAAVGSLYALFLGFVVYRELTLTKLRDVLIESATGTASVAIIIAAASPMSWILSYEQAHVTVADFFQGNHFSPLMILLIINVVILILGCFLESIAIMVMTIPILMPVIQDAGIDPVHFGVLLVLNVVIGAVTPPVGTVMYVVCSIGKVPIWDFTKEVWPYLIALVLCLLIIGLVPQVSLFLPNLLMPVK